MYCREFTTHTTVLWMGAAIFFCGFMVGTLKSCESPEGPDDKVHRQKMELMNLEYKLKQTENKQSHNHPDYGK